MIKYKLGSEGEGIRLLQNRFRCHHLCADRVFNVREEYRKRFELGLVLSLFFMIVFTQSLSRVEGGKAVVKQLNFAIQVDEIPQTVQHRAQSAPSRPSVPIATEDEEIPEDETIEFTNLDLEDIPLPPPPLPQTEEVDYSTPLFIPYDEPPIPIGGLAAIQRHLVYPEIGRLAGIEGMVILHVQVEKDGKVKNVKVAKSLNVEAFTEAAIKAVRSVEWKPAKQRDRPIMVWVSVPIRFILNQVAESY